MKVIGFVLVMAFVLRFDVFQRTPPQLQGIQGMGEIRVGMLPSPAHYIAEGDRLYGREYELIRLFSEQIGVTPRLIPVNNMTEMAAALLQGRIQIGVADLSLAQDEGTSTLMGLKKSLPYHEADWFLICKSGRTCPKDISDVGPNRLLIPRDGHGDFLLKRLQSSIQAGQWIVHPELGYPEILAQINEYGYFFTILEQDSFAYFSRIYPALRKAGRPITVNLSWVFREMDDRSLYERANVFLEWMQEKAITAQRPYLQSGSSLPFFDTVIFLKRIEDLLPKYRYYFQGASRRTAIDWRLLAAISYQESHWQPDAKSFSGVQGLMMLTKPTALSLGIRDRVDPQSSISGGAKYLAKLLEHLPERIQEPDRTWLALAAYNVGPGHLEDARKLAQKLGYNPDLWEDLKLILPLLSQRAWYTQTRYGYARGEEPVAFVTAIRQYYDVLRVYLTRNSYADLGTFDPARHTMPATPLLAL